MSLEERLIHTLHRADDFEPSPDLFARVERSLEEDLRHRRRVRWVAASLVAGAIAVAFFLGEVISISSTGRLTASGWAPEMLTIVFQVVLVLTLGPMIRRFGKPFIADVFRLDPDTGRHFLDLLDIAFYLFFFGAIVEGADIDALQRTVVLGADAGNWVERVAVLSLGMGIAHSFTIAVLPLMGLFFSSSVRRARRHQAGAAALPVAVRAEQAERVARLIVWGIAGLAVFVTLIGVGLFLVGGVFRL